MQNQNFALKLPTGLRIQGWGDHDHALADLRPFHLRNSPHSIIVQTPVHPYLFQGEAGRLAGAHLFDRHPLPVDAFDSDRDETSQRIRSQHQNVIQTDDTFQRRPGNHCAHALYDRKIKLQSPHY